MKVYVKVHFFFHFFQVFFSINCYSFKKSIDYLNFIFNEAVSNSFFNPQTKKVDIYFFLFCVSVHLIFVKKISKVKTLKLNEFY